MPLSEAKKKANRKWNKNNYEQLSVVVPVGEREKIKARAGQLGLSLNGYVRLLLSIEGQRESVVHPNGMFYLSPEMVDLLDDYYRAERSIQAHENAIADAAPEEQKNFVMDWQKSIEYNKEYMKSVEAVIGKEVLNEFRTQL